MPGPLGEPDVPEVEAPDYLGAQVPVAFKAQAALPVGGPAVGSPVGPVQTPGGDGGGGGDAGPSGVIAGDPSPGLRTDAAGDSVPGLDAALSIGPKLLNVADRIFQPAPGVEFTQTPSGDLTFMPNEQLRERQYPEPAPFDTEIPTVPTLGDVPLSEPIPDDIIAMFGGDRAAFEAAFPNLTVTPDQIAAMADAGELTGLGIDSAAALQGVDLGSLGTALGIANVLTMGLRMGGVLEGDASTVVGNLMGLAGFGLSSAALLAGSTSISTIGGVAGGVAAPFIAWGMNELSRAMRPNVEALRHRLDERFFTQGLGEVQDFNSVAQRIRDAGITDPVVLQQLLNEGERSVLDFYNRGVEVGHGGETTGGGMASASGHVGGFDPVTQGFLMGPIREAMMELQALQNALGGDVVGSQDWYSIFGGQLNPWSLNESLYGPSGVSNNPVGNVEPFTLEQLQAAAGGLSPLDFALQQFAQSSPDWAVPNYGMRPA